MCNVSHSRHVREENLKLIILMDLLAQEDRETVGIRQKKSNYFIKKIPKERIKVKRCNIMVDYLLSWDLRVRKNRSFGSPSGVWFHFL